MKKILYPGSFDPLTNGHLDLIKRASKLFDEVIVGVAINRDKNYFLTQTEKVTIIKECCAGLPNVTVTPFSGLIVNALNACKAQAILRGLRAFSDFEYELQMALMNRSLNHKCETIFMMPTPRNSFVSSSIVKEAALLGADFSQYVPAPVFELISRKLEVMRKPQ
ncbi:MAG: pantetheine-phosphate adenylyltransferase [Victivallaceae bacterium]|nr:pantetheine-phosphate adenylyltransferase [Victivallaceae bacterium]